MVTVLSKKREGNVRTSPPHRRLQPSRGLLLEPLPWFDRSYILMLSGFFFIMLHKCTNYGV